MANATGPISVNNTGNRRGELMSFPLDTVQIWKGAAASFPIGATTDTNATPLVAGTANLQFIGVWTESFNNQAGAGGIAGATSGVANSGGKFTQVQRDGAVCFNQTGTTITNVHTNYNLYFADDNTVTLASGTQWAGTLITVDASGNLWVDITNAVRQPSYSAGSGWIALTTNGAINPHIQANYIITKAGVLADTLAAPTAGVDDGKEITISSATANAHTLTATGLLSTGTASVNVATFAAQLGAGLRLKAYNGLWQVLSSPGITFS